MIPCETFPGSPESEQIYQASPLQDQVNTPVG